MSRGNKEGNRVKQDVHSLLLYRIFVILRTMKYCPVFCCDDELFSRSEKLLRTCVHATEIPRKDKNESVSFCVR